MNSRGAPSKSTVRDMTHKDLLAEFRYTCGIDGDNREEVNALEAEILRRLHSPRKKPALLRIAEKAVRETMASYEEAKKNPPDYSKIFPW